MEPSGDPPFNYFRDMLDQHQRGICAGFLPIHRVNIASLLNYQALGWRFDSLRPPFILYLGGLICSLRFHFFACFHERDYGGEHSPVSSGVNIVSRSEQSGLIPDNLADDFDFLLNGVIDSFGILEMISAIENEFQIQLDLADLDAEQITILGPLSRYVAERGYFRPESFPDSDEARG